jgi:hypothetical protein
MATIGHKNLTGTQLHEPKGIAAAAANKLYVSNGSGSGTWQKITADQLTGSGNPYGGQLFHLQHQESSGVSGGTFTSGSWAKRTLNTTLTNEISSASVASSVLSLPAGTYEADALAIAYRVNGHQLRLYNTTDGSTLLVGLTGRNDSADTQNSIAHVRGRFTLSGTKNVELQHQGATTRAADGFGIAASLNTEVYVDIQIRKVA